jgi:hypothetical protein
MWWPEHDPDESTASEVPSISQESCRALDRVIRDWGDSSTDVFGAFLKIHSCVCHRVAASKLASDSLLKLNHLFVQRCLDTFQAFQEGDFSPRRLSSGWIAIYDDWIQLEESANDSRSLVLLARMAVVHILEDLENVLFYVDIDKSEYDAVFYFIVDCIDRVRPEYSSSLSMKGQIIDWLVHDLGERARNWTIEELRELAWQSAIRRKKLKSRALALKAAQNLQRWYDSGFPQRWVREHNGVWDHETWALLVEDLKLTEFWPMEPDDVGRLLEDLKRS